MVISLPAITRAQTQPNPTSTQEIDNHQMVEDARRQNPGKPIKSYYSEEERTRAYREMQRCISEWNNLVKQGTEVVIDFYPNVVDIGSIADKPIVGGASAKAVSKILDDANLWNGLMPKVLEDWIWKKRVPVTITSSIGSRDSADIWSDAVGLKLEKKKIYETEREKVDDYRKMQKTIADWNILVDQGEIAVIQKYPDVPNIQSIGTIRIDGAKHAQTVAKTLGKFWLGLNPGTLRRWIQDEKLFPAAILAEIGSIKSYDVWANAIGIKVNRQYRTDQEKVDAYHSMQKMISDWNELVKQGPKAVTQKYGDVKDIKTISKLMINSHVNADKVQIVLGEYWVGLLPRTLESWLYGDKSYFPTALVTEIGSNESSSVWSHVLGTKTQRKFRTDNERLKAYREMQVSIHDWNKLVTQGTRVVSQKYPNLHHIKLIWKKTIIDTESAVLVSKILGKNWSGVSAGTFQNWITDGLPKELVESVGSTARSKVWQYTLETAGAAADQQKPIETPVLTSSNAKNIPLDEKSDEQVEQELRDTKTFFDWWNRSSSFEKKNRFSNIEKSPSIVDVLITTYSNAMKVIQILRSQWPVINPLQIDAIVMKYRVPKNILLDVGGTDLKTLWSYLCKSGIAIEKEHLSEKPADVTETKLKTFRTAEQNKDLSNRIKKLKNFVVRWNIGTHESRIRDFGMQGSDDLNRKNKVQSSSLSRLDDLAHTNRYIRSFEDLETILFLINQTNPNSIQGIVSVAELRQLIESDDIPNEIVLYMERNFQSTNTPISDPAQKLESFICEVPMIHVYTNGISLSGLFGPLDYIQDQINNFLRQSKDWWLTNLFPGDNKQNGNPQDLRSSEGREEGAGRFVGMFSKSNSGGSENHRKPKNDQDIIQSILDMRAFTDFWNTSTIDTKAKKFGHIPEKYLHSLIENGQSFDAIQRYTKLPLMTNSYLANLSYDRKIPEEFLQQNNIGSFNHIWSFITQNQNTETKIKNLINFVAGWNFADEATRRSLYIGATADLKSLSKSQTELVQMMRSDQLHDMKDVTSAIELLKVINPNQVQQMIAIQDLNRLFRLDLIPVEIENLIQSSNRQKLTLATFERFLCVDPNSNDQSRIFQVQANGISSDFFNNLYDQTIGRLFRFIKSKKENVETDKNAAVTDLRQTNEANVQDLPTKSETDMIVPAENKVFEPEVARPTPKTKKEITQSELTLKDANEKMIQIEGLQDFVKQWNRNVVDQKIEEIYGDVPNIKTISSRLIQNLNSAIDVYKVIGRANWKGMIPKSVEIMMYDKRKMPQTLLFAFGNNNREISNFIFGIHSDFVQMLELKDYIQQLNEWLDSDQIKEKFPKLQLEQPLKEIKSYNRLRKAYEAITKAYVWPYMLPKTLDTLISNGEVPQDLVEEAGGNDHESVLNFMCNNDDVSKLKALRDFIADWKQLSPEQRKEKYKAPDDVSTIKIDSFNMLREVFYKVTKKTNLRVMSPRRLEYLGHQEIPSNIAQFAGSDYDSLLTYVGAKMSVHDSFLALAQLVSDWNRMTPEDRTAKFKNVGSVSNKQIKNPSTLKSVYDQFVIENDWDAMKPSTLMNLKDVPSELKDIVGSEDKDAVIAFVFGNRHDSNISEVKQGFYLPFIAEDMWEEMKSFYGPYSQMMDAQYIMFPPQDAESRNHTLDRYFTLKKPSKEIVEKLIWLPQHVSRDRLIQFDNLLSDYIFSKDVLEKIRQNLSNLPTQPVNYGRDHIQQSLAQYEPLIIAIENITKGRPLATEEIENDFMRAASGYDPIFFRSLLEHYTFKPELLRSGLVKLIGRSHANATSLIIIQLLANSNLLTKFDLNQTLMQTIYATTYNNLGPSVNYDMVNVLRSQLLPKNIVKIQFIMDARRGNLLSIQKVWNNPDISVSIKHVALTEAIQMKQVEILREFAVDSELQDLLDQSLVQFVKSFGDQFDMLASKDSRFTEVLKILASASTKKAIGSLHDVKKTSEVSKILEEFQIKTDDFSVDGKVQKINNKQKNSSDETPGSDGVEFYKRYGWGGALDRGLPSFLNPDHEFSDPHSMQAHSEGNEFGPYANQYAMSSSGIQFNNGGGSSNLSRITYRQSSLKEYVRDIVNQILKFNRANSQTQITNTATYIQYSDQAQLPSFREADQFLIQHENNSFRLIFDQWRSELSKLPSPTTPLPPMHLDHVIASTNDRPKDLPLSEQIKPAEILVESKLIDPKQPTAPELPKKSPVSLLTNEQKMQQIQQMQQTIKNWNRLVLKGEKAVLRQFPEIKDIRMIVQTKIVGATSAATVSKVLGNLWQGVMPRTFDSWIQKGMIPDSITDEINSDKFADVWSYAIGANTSRKYLTKKEQVDGYRKMQKTIQEWNMLVKKGPRSVLKKFRDIKNIRTIYNREIKGATDANAVAEILGDRWEGISPKVISDWIKENRVPAELSDEAGSGKHADLWTNAIGSKTIRMYLTDEDQMDAYHKMQQMVQDWNNLVDLGPEFVRKKYDEIKDIELIDETRIESPVQAMTVANILGDSWKGVTPGNLQTWITGTRRSLPAELVQEIGSSKSGDVWSDVLGTKTRRAYRTDEEMMQAYEEMQSSIAEWNALVEQGSQAVIKKYPDMSGIEKIWMSKIEGPYSAVAISSVLGKSWNGLKPGTFQRWITKKSLPKKLVEKVGTIYRSSLWNYTLSTAAIGKSMKDVTRTMDEIKNPVELTTLIVPDVSARPAVESSGKPSLTFQSEKEEPTNKAQKNIQFDPTEPNIGGSTKVTVDNVEKKTTDAYPRSTQVAKSQVEIEKRKAELSKNFQHYAHVFLPDLTKESAKKVSDRATSEIDQPQNLATTNPKSVHENLQTFFNSQKKQHVGSSVLLQVYDQVVEHRKSVEDATLGELHDQLQETEHGSQTQILQWARISRGPGLREDQAKKVAIDVMTLLEMYAETASYAQIQQVLTQLPKGYVHPEHGAGDPGLKGISIQDHQVVISSYAVAKIIYAQSPTESMTIDHLNEQIQMMTETPEHKTVRLKQSQDQNSRDEKNQRKDHETKFEEGRL